MEKEIVEFSGQAFEFEKSQERWHLIVKRSDIATQNIDELRILNLHHPMFLESEFSYDSDSVIFTYFVKDQWLSYTELKSRTFSEKLRFSLNLLKLREVLKLPVTFFLAPENIFVTKDGCPLIAYRGLPEVMVPKQIDEADFLRQVKCFIYTLFTKDSFSNLYQGSLEVVPVSPFLKKIRELETIEALEKELSANYHEKFEEEQAQLTLVSKSQYKLYKFASIWLTVGLVLLLAPLTYLVFIQGPFKEKLLKADTAFIKVDYTGVISKLENVALKDLPYTQKYELAYSYIQGLKFSDEQRKTILNNVTLKSDELYLDYWIEIGRNRTNNALDIAKRLDDSDVIIYALTQKIKEVREDKNLSGQKREEQLSNLKSEYEKYWKERTAKLTPDSSQKSSSSSTEASKSSTTSSSK